MAKAGAPPPTSSAATELDSRRLRLRPRLRIPTTHPSPRNRRLARGMTLPAGGVMNNERKEHAGFCREFCGDLRSDVAEKSQEIGPIRHSAATGGIGVGRVFGVGGSQRGTCSALILRSSASQREGERLEGRGRPPIPLGRKRRGLGRLVVRDARPTAALLTMRREES